MKPKKYARIVARQELEQRQKQGLGGSYNDALSHAYREIIRKNSCWVNEAKPEAISEH